MTLESLNKWLMLIANLGVIAGIVFLAIEIGQNSDQLEAQTRNTMFEARGTLENDFANNTGGIADIVSKARRGETLTDPEEQRLLSRRFRTLRTFEYIVQESTDEILTKQVPYMVSIFILDPGLKDVWQIASIRNGFDPEFELYMNEEILPMLQQEFR